MQYQVDKFKLLFFSRQEDVIQISTGASARFQFLISPRIFMFLY